MNVRLIATPEEFRDRAGSFLEEREAENNLILGNLTGLLEHGSGAGEPPSLCTVEEGGRVVAAAMRTPPRNLVLTRGPAVAMAVLADYIARQRLDIPGIHAPVESAQWFLTAWKKLSPRTVISTRPHRGHVCEGVIALPPAPGRFDQARPQDVERLAAMRASFLDEIGEPGRDEDHRAWVQAAVQDGRLFVWRDSDVVSMALWTGRTRHGVRIGYVYTPTEYRSRGYAGSLTAALTQRLLDDGRRFCFLFTVTTNAIANRIYARIGYRPLADYLLANFEPS